MGGNKKKLDTELETYFPAYFGNDLEYLEHLRDMYLYRIEKALGEERDSDLEMVYDYFLSINTPKIFNPFDERCVLINSEKEFEDICNSIYESASVDIKEKTVFEFYSLISHLEKKAAKMKNNNVTT